MAMNLKEALEKQEGKNKKETKEQPEEAKKAAEKIKEEIEKIDEEKTEVTEKEGAKRLFNFKEENDFMTRIIKLHFYGKCNLRRPEKDYILNKPIKDIEEGDNEEKIGNYILNTFIQKAMENIPFTPLTDTAELINSTIAISNDELFKVIDIVEDKITIRLNESELTFIHVQ